MLSIPIEATELFNELTGEFVTLKPVTLKLEHSLISISKWEAKWHKPFSNSEKTAEEMRDYIRCMTLNGDIAPVYLRQIRTSLLLMAGWFATKYTIEIVK